MYPDSRFNLYPQRARAFEEKEREKRARSIKIAISGEKEGKKTNTKPQLKSFKARERELSFATKLTLKKEQRGQKRRRRKGNEEAKN